MARILILTSKNRCERYFDLETLPADWELVFAGLQTDTEKIPSLCEDADYIFADAIQSVPASVIEALPQLKLIHSEGVAFNAIDCEAAAKRGIYVCNNAAVNAGAVAEHAVMLSLAVLRRLVEGDALVRAGKQIDAKGSFIDDGIHELAGCTVGLIGFGAIAQEFAKRLQPFGCTVLYNKRHALDSAQEAALGVRFASIDEIYETCDVVSLHVPVNAQTEHMIDSTALASMKKSAILINTARGEIVDQEALRDALISGEIAGAGLDTLSPEPVRSDNPLLNLPDEAAHKLTLAPHVGGTTVEAFKRMHANVWAAVKAVEAKERPANIVNGI